MSKLEELINRLCPNGVEYKRLGEIGKFYGGITGKSKNDFIDGNAKFITYKNVYDNFSLNLDVEDKVKINENENQRTLEYGDIIFTGSSETPDECGISSVLTKETDEKLYLNSFCFFLRLNDKNILNPEFAKHLFRSSNLRYQIGKTASGVTRFNVSKKAMENVCIPVPPLEVQSEIARILDKLIELSLELSLEHLARKKQFTYYEEKLLFNSDFDKVKLGDLCVVNQGLQLPINERKTEPGENRYFYITVQFLKGGNENYYIENPQPSVICYKDDILVTRTGSTGKVITGVEGCFHNNFFKVEPNNRILKRYLYFVLNSKIMFNKMLSVASGGTVPDLPHKKFYNLEIFLPSIDEQQKIVNILEKIYKITNDSIDGLPAEIEKRQKQYEYYRDKLLAFKECEVNE